MDLMCYEIDKSSFDFKQTKNKKILKCFDDFCILIYDDQCNNYNNNKAINIIFSFFCTFCIEIFLQICLQLIRLIELSNQGFEEKLNFFLL